MSEEDVVARQLQADSVDAAKLMSGMGFETWQIAAALGMSGEAVETVLASSDASAAAVEDPVEELVAEEETPQEVEEPAARVSPVWPPPPAPGEVWELVQPRRGEKVRVRWVRLWGQRVRVDAGGEVFCHACLEFVGTGELSRPGHSHPVGLQLRQGVTDVFAERLVRERPDWDVAGGVW